MICIYQIIIIEFNWRYNKKIIIDILAWFILTLYIVNYDQNDKYNSLFDAIPVHEFRYTHRSALPPRDLLWSNQIILRN